MKKSVKKLKNVIVAMTAVWVLTIGVATAWAAITVIHNDHINHDKVKSSQYASTEVQKEVKRARAPEPGTLALFGGGFLGMIVSFDSCIL